jgi:hypothetical protein
MICGRCNYRFSLLQVPIENRVIKRWYSLFECPECGALLKPCGTRIVISNLIVFFLGIIGVLLLMSAFWLSSSVLYAVPIIGVLVILLIFVGKRYDLTEVQKVE